MRMSDRVMAWMFRIMALAFICVQGYGGQAMDTKYSALKIGFEAITTDGAIDPNKWEKWDFAFCEPITVKGSRYIPIGNLFFLSSAAGANPNAINMEQTRRYEMEANAWREMSLVGGRLYYQGKMLKYSGKVRGKELTWGKTVWDEPPQAFRFGRYLIFMVPVRMPFRETPFDFVVYNLQDDSFAVRKVSGPFPAIEMFRLDEAVPDPRGERSLK